MRFSEAARRAKQALGRLVNARMRLRLRAMPSPPWSVGDAVLVTLLNAGITPESASTISGTCARRITLDREDHRAGALSRSLIDNDRRISEELEAPSWARLVKGHGNIFVAEKRTWNPCCNEACKGARSYYGSRGRIVLIV